MVESSQIGHALAVTEETDPFVIGALDAAALVHDAPWRRFGVLGDSLALGTGDPSPGYLPEGWPERVAGVLRRVRPDLAYLNVAKYGATTTETLAEQTAPMRAFAPDLLHVNAGANDIMRRTPDFEQIEAKLRGLYEFAAGTGAQLTTIQLGRAFVVPVFPDFTEHVRRVNQINAGLAAEFGALVADTWDHPFNDRPNLLSADRIHFSTSGQAVIATELIKQLAHRLAQVRR
ncbi:SGNH/GDSL hydrolase family protein [Nocardia huaxiensis]|uniref:SGNH/GDSL hydrolase family protein n=1 Tax=Nocardia huaxiensis TaxID=2755382 RepID=UPI001E5CB9D7|nr:SGNH/GDSL hydrolase family protein [Nocardia huaxiensis]UFS93060.1 SGNH/GDSL hydrolase family protein [Nocardia huaxiensis]